MDASPTPSSTFTLTVSKFTAIVEYMASLKRNEMHHVMKKAEKTARRTMDLNTLGSMQAFQDSVLLKESSLDKYEAIVHKLAFVVGEKKTEQDKMAALNAKNLPVAMKEITAYIAAGGNLLDEKNRWMVALLSINAEVSRDPKGPDDMTHVEFQRNIEAEKAKKANQGRGIIAASSASCVPLQVSLCFVSVSAFLVYSALRY